MDYSKLVLDIIEPMVSDPTKLRVEVEPREQKNSYLVIVTATNQDTSKLIGKGGSVADAIREVVSVASKLNNQHVYVKFQSFEDINK